MSQLSFKYQAIDSTGGRARGVIGAPTREDAYRKVVESGLKPISIKPAQAGLFRRRKKISTKDLSHLTYQFSVLMEARVPIADGLRSIAEQETNTQLQQVIEEIAGKIEAGESITSAMEPHRALFGDTYVETLHAAEVSGNLIEVLAHLATMLDRQYEMSKEVKGALMYPICVMGALLLAVSFLVIFVVPKFASMFESRGVDLPMLTQGLLSGSELVRDYWYLLVGGGVGGILLCRRLWRDEASRCRIDRFFHMIPHLRTMLVGMGVARFAHVFGLALRSGLSLLDALELAGTASGRPLMQADAERMRKQVNEGGRLADVLIACDYLPGFSRRMLMAGEEAGELPRMCQIIARHYDREVSHLAKNVATIIEPVMIAGLAGVVLVIALSIFLPMWNMAAVIG